MASLAIIPSGVSHDYRATQKKDRVREVDSPDHNLYHLGNTFRHLSSFKSPKQTSPASVSMGAKSQPWSQSCREAMKGPFWMELWCLLIVVKYMRTCWEWGCHSSVASLSMYVQSYGNVRIDETYTYTHSMGMNELNISPTAIHMKRTNTHTLTMANVQFRSF